MGSPAARPGLGVRFLAGVRPLPLFADFNAKNAVEPEGLARADSGFGRPFGRPKQPPCCWGSTPLTGRASRGGKRPRISRVPGPDRGRAAELRRSSGTERKTPLGRTEASTGLLGLLARAGKVPLMARKPAQVLVVYAFADDSHRSLYEQPERRLFSALLLETIGPPGRGGSTAGAQDAITGRDDPAAAGLSVRPENIHVSRNASRPRGGAALEAVRSLSDKLGYNLERGGNDPLRVIQRVGDLVWCSHLP